MARYNFIGRARDTFGNVVPGVNVYIYLAGTTSPATVFSAQTGGIGISVTPQIKSDAMGSFSFYVDDTIHSGMTLFDIVVSDTTYRDVNIFRMGLSGYSGLGFSGHSGYSGYSGKDGAAASSGYSGYSGYSGVGTSGYSGYSGSGTSGYSGYSGVGTSGYSGYSGMAGNETYTNLEVTPVTVGGIVSGSTFDSQTTTQMWTALLYPYQNPTFSSFVMSGQTTILEVGSVVGANKTFTWGTTNSTNIKPDIIRIDDITNAVVISTGLTNDGSEVTTSPSVHMHVSGSNVWRITGTNTNSVNFTRDFTVYWRWRLYYGESTNTSLDETGIEALRVSSLSTGYAATYAFSAGGYKYLCYPVLFGTATTFKDSSTNLNVPFEPVEVVSVTNSLGETTNYNVHRTTNILGSSIGIIVS